MRFEDVYTVFWRDWVVLNRRLAKFILSRMISPVLYLVAFGWGLGRNLSMSGGSYLDFILPGIMALNAMNISFSAVGSPLNMSRLYHKTLEEYLIAPVSPASFVAGKVLAGALRGLISCTVIFVLAYLFGAKLIITTGFILTLSLTCLLFAALGLVAAMLINSHEDMASFNTYVLLPMSFLCATFFTPDRLPVVVKWFIELLPLTHATYALRAIGAGAETPWLSVIVLAAYTVILLAIGVWTMIRVRD
ncbi:ABC transporter permease [Sporomusa acidovorans]|uniref:Transport permease protein n=1 Tax=Sporomusa acidovorans (strain ATCC 49682 / DSM 3132 / Mol) TaxID=1123286 RepID=A0ABZ3IYQ3_SPOA4|nr:ABC transporter permease [Sporomusa acidovorans]OZC16341.1 inner membrane transport permease YadH [Sporomusa acidovorans DSM 3132]SDF73386.1 ABC-type polysaccharide/polyol phosphate export permease [Sporomusa acidovorans]